MTDPVSQLADRLEREIAAAFLAAVEEIRANIDVPSLIAAAERGDQEDVYGYVGDRLRPVRLILDRAFKQSGTLAAHRLSLRFEPTEATAAAARASAVGSAMRELIADTARAMLQAAYRTTLAPAAVVGALMLSTVPLQAAEKAILIREAIGLSPAQGTSLAVFRAALENALAQQQPEGPRRPGFVRQPPAAPQPLPAHWLRHLSAPQRSVIKKASRLALTRAKVEALVAQQRQQVLEIRANAIGAAGAITITNAGESASWQQAVQRRDLGPRWRRFWRDAGDERVRHVHREVSVLNPDGVAVDEPFETALGPRFYPPLEPGCRCRIELREVAA